MNLDIGANREIDEDRVPDELVGLIPYVKKWGYEHNEDQDQFVARMLLERPAEVSEFKAICDEYHEKYHKWLSSIPQKHKNNMTISDWSHPSFAFTSMYGVRDLLPFEEREITDEIRAVKQRMKEEWRQEKYLQVMDDADAAFRERNYVSYVEMLEPYEDLMSGAIMKKLQLAKKKRGT
jgi:hypothetical protein